MDTSTGTPSRNLIEMRERITAARCIDCNRPVFVLNAWRCDDCVEEHYREIADSEAQMSCGDDEADGEGSQ